jgi:hypothetical protein
MSRPIPVLRALFPALALLALAAPVRAALFGGDAPIDAFAPERPGDATVDHGPWNDFLDRYLVTDTADGVHRVRYDAVSAADHAALDDWLARIQAVDPLTLTRDGQMAYWIDLYNALTVMLILDQLPLESIRDIGGLFGTGPWSRELATVNGRALTLDDIEHRILRPHFTDPRIHFAVNCASIGCPDLAAEAFTAGNLEALLERGTRRYVNHPRGVRFEDGVLHLSSLFDWYRGDFPEGRAALLAWLAGYAEPALAERLRGHEGRIRHDYDWSLNAAP